MNKKNKIRHSRKKEKDRKAEVDEKYEKKQPSTANNFDMIFTTNH